MDASHAFHLERNQRPVLGVLRATRTVQADRRTQLEFGWKSEGSSEGRFAEDHAAEDTAGLVEPNAIHQRSQKNSSPSPTDLFQMRGEWQASSAPSFWLFGVQILDECSSYWTAIEQCSASLVNQQWFTSTTSCTSLLECSSRAHCSEV